MCQNECRGKPDYSRWPTNKLEALIAELTAERQSRFTLDPKPETPFEEGARLRSEGLSLSDLWGDTSEANFEQFEEVLRGWCGDDYDRLNAELVPQPPTNWLQRLTAIWRKA